MPPSAGHEKLNGTLGSFLTNMLSMGASDASQGITKRVAIDLVATGEPGVGATHQSHRQARFSAYVQTRGTSGRQLDEFEALEESIGEVLGPIGDLRQAAGDAGGIEL